MTRDITVSDLQPTAYSLQPPIFLGLDDTDTLDHPGTNQLARHLVALLADEWHVSMILRHQLLDDPRVPYTSQNGSASLALAPRGTPSVERLIDVVRRAVVDWCPAGSDPGLCVCRSAPDAVMDFGRRCQRELILQSEARELAARHEIYLEGLGGTEDGVIGALAAVGLAATGDDGRVVHLGSSPEDFYNIGGERSLAELRACGVAEVRMLDSTDLVTRGTIDVGKRLRPNVRGGKVVLYATPVASGDDEPRWQAMRLN